MANTKTTIDSINAVISADLDFMGIPAPVVVSAYRCAFDTPGADLTIHTPAADKYASIIGWQHCDSGAHNVSILSGTAGEGQVELNTLEFNPGSGLSSPIDGKPLFVCALGKSLVLNVSAACKILLYVAEFKKIRL